jgi:hypothetical protein
LPPARLGALGATPAFHHGLLGIPLSCRSKRAGRKRSFVNSSRIRLEKAAPRHAGVSAVPARRLAGRTPPQPGPGASRHGGRRACPARMWGRASALLTVTSCVADRRPGGGQTEHPGDSQTVDVHGTVEPSAQRLPRQARSGEFLAAGGRRDSLSIARRSPRVIREIRGSDLERCRDRAHAMDFSLKSAGGRST